MASEPTERAYWRDPRAQIAVRVDAPFYRRLILLRDASPSHSVNRVAEEAIIALYREIVGPDPAE